MSENVDVTSGPAVQITNRRLFSVAAVAAGGLLLLLTAGAVPRLAAGRALAADSSAVARQVQRVTIAEAERAAATGSFMLPGSVDPRQQTQVYARTSGYVRRWLVDIGARVRSGQLLAEIESPETDQELRQARARLRQAQAALGLARTTLTRYEALASQDAVSRQELDDRAAGQDVALAALGQEEANVQRLAELRAFQRVTAPYAAIVTARNVEVGSLITDAGGSADRETGRVVAMFNLAQTDTVRVVVNVPQAYAADIAPGQVAEVLVREHSQRTFAGLVTRTANALDPTSRTLRTEVEVANQDRALLPGTYAQVRFTLPRSERPVLIPAAALVLSGEEPRVAVVGRDRRVRFQVIEIGRDLGAVVEVIKGVSPGASLVLNPSDQLDDGALVDPHKEIQPETEPRDPAERSTLRIPPAGGGAAPASSPPRARKAPNSTRQ